jgi:hypothetical protein
MSASAAPDANPSSAPKRESTRDVQLWRLCAWAGPLYLVGVGVCFGLVAGFIPPPREDWTAQHLAHYFDSHQVRIRIGMEGVIIFGAFYILWSLAIARVMEHVEGPRGFLSKIQRYGGLLTGLITVVCGVAWLVASFRASTRNPQDTQLISDFAFMFFTTTIIVTIFEIVAYGALWLTDVEQLIPRWFGHLSVGCSAIFLPVYLVPWFTKGPFAWQGAVNFYVGLVAFFAWLAVASWQTLRAINTIVSQAEDD